MNLSGPSPSFSSMSLRPWDTLPLAHTLVVFRKCIFWSLVMCFVIVMDGYDGFLIPSFYAVPAFQKNFGVQLPDGSWTIQAKWQTAYMVGAPIGRIVGALGVGFLADKFGRKWLTIIGLCVLSGITFLVFFAVNKTMLIIGWFLSGLIWGLFNTLAPTYVSEICPVCLRSTFAAAINLSWVVGQFISTAVITSSEWRTDEWAYRIPLGVQWVFPVVLIPLVILMPESPWWLLKQSREKDARKVLEQLMDPQEVDIDLYLDYMCRTLIEEAEIGGFRDCFKGSDLRRTEICCLVYFFQPLSGLYLLSYTAYFLELTGIPQNIVFKLTLGVTGLAVLSSLLSPFIILQFPRRSIYLGALLIMSGILFGIGISACYTTQAAKWTAAVLIYVWVGTYDATIGPLTYVIVSESSSVKLRSKTIALASITNSIMILVLHIAVPYMMNEEEANMGGYVGFVYAPFCLVAVAWAYWRLPELKGMSFMEIDKFFQEARGRRSRADNNRLTSCVSQQSFHKSSDALDRLKQPGHQTTSLESLGVGQLREVR
uniref:Putative Sugar Porter n=1 Tax=Yarrowia galli TaxID=197054 RepID=A0A1N6MBZ0_9ASCO|nr:putative Sugar Porter [Yarrowia galli]